MTKSLKNIKYSKSPQIYVMRKKKLCENCNKTVKIARCDSYSILFNLCGSSCFYHRCQNQRNRVCLFISTHFECIYFFACFIQNWEEIESLKNEIPGIVVEKSLTSVFPLPYQPCIHFGWEIRETGKRPDMLH